MAGPPAEIEGHGWNDVCFVVIPFGLGSHYLEGNPVVVLKFKMPVESSHPVVVIGDVFQRRTHFLVCKDETDMGLGIQFLLEAEDIHQAPVIGDIRFVLPGIIDFWGRFIVGAHEAHRDFPQFSGELGPLEGIHDVPRVDQLERCIDNKSLFPYQAFQLAVDFWGGGKLGGFDSIIPSVVFGKRNRNCNK